MSITNVLMPTSTYNKLKLMLTYVLLVIGPFARFITVMNEDLLTINSTLSL